MACIPFLLSLLTVYPISESVCTPSWWAMAVGKRHVLVSDLVIQALTVDRCILQYLDLDTCVRMHMHAN